VALQLAFQPRGDVFEGRKGAIEARRRGFQRGNKDICSGNARSADYWCDRLWNCYQLL